MKARLEKGKLSTEVRAECEFGFLGKEVFAPLCSLFFCQLERAIRGKWVPTLALSSLNYRER